MKHVWWVIQDSVVVQLVHFHQYVVCSDRSFFCVQLLISSEDSCVAEFIRLFSQGAVVVSVEHILQKVLSLLG